MNNLYYTKNNQTISIMSPIKNISFNQNINESQNMTMDTLSNISYHSNIKLTNYNQIYNNNVNNCNNFIPYQKRRYTAPLMKKTKKKVKFNEVVDVFVVKSYKKYNKCEDSFSVDDYFDQNKDSKSNSIKKRKNGKNCECIIF